MKSEVKFDWSVLKGPMIVFSLSVVLSASLVGGTWYFRDTMQKKYSVEKRRFQTVSNQYLAVDQEEKQVKQFLPGFITLYNEGLLGEERRLNWIETLREVSDKIQLLSLRYEIGSQIPYTPDYSVNTGIYRMFSSPMKLNVDLLHVVDLERLFQDLNRQAQGIYNVSSCKLTRRGISVEFKPEVTPNISAECDLKWFNLKRSDGSAIMLTKS